MSKGLCKGHREQERRERGEETFFSKKYSLSNYIRKKDVKFSESQKALSVYYDTLIRLLSKNPRCQNCGCTIDYRYLPYNNIAHILAKSTHKSVSSNLDNHLFLCDFKDGDGGRSCHHYFDNRGFDFVRSMPVFTEALRRFKKIKPFVLEKTNIFLIFEAELKNYEQS